eukprot:Sspe_Gene.89470::Locus_61236_Transcript_1_1_Confidence_1.000_Length_1120::g.89470::m.89470/K11864/BRCC3, BRCC36; BRCA1/BRCA2-containing complex subunit 3
MSLQHVYVTDSVVFSGLAHALTTEEEEIMGLCLGTVENGVSYVWDTFPLIRRDKRKDRVEIDPSQQVEATMYCEKLASEQNRKMRVVGWYHSHPRITCPPSHVDLRTQANYQSMDPWFVGLIFSVFRETTYHAGQVQVHSFQRGSPADRNSPFAHVVESSSADVHQGGNHIHLCIPTTIISTQPGSEYNGPVKIPSVPLYEKTAEVLDLLEEEELHSYERERESDHPFSPLYTASIFQKSMIKILEGSAQPMINLIQTCDLRQLELEEQRYNEDRKRIAEEMEQVEAAIRKEEEVIRQLEAEPNR